MLGAVFWGSLSLFLSLPPLLDLLNVCSFSFSSLHIVLIKLCLCLNSGLSHTLYPELAQGLCYRILATSGSGIKLAMILLHFPFNDCYLCFLSFNCLMAVRGQELPVACSGMQGLSRQAVKRCLCISFKIIVCVSVFPRDLYR